MSASATLIIRNGTIIDGSGSDPIQADLAVTGAAWAVTRLSHDNAAAVGLNDRGLLQVGMKADLNVIDYDRLVLRGPEIAYDLPPVGKRLVQRTECFDATVVSAAVAYRNGEPTAALPDVSYVDQKLSDQPAPPNDHPRHPTLNRR